ncbi:hypothetical protein [Nocardiopsis sp. LOL_012]|uniref:hypothetical protein n=1 Tax=Nocardiopsis sp. LOL_012 TaxID=3345409 RepID=UPI003A848E4F
MRRFLPLFLSPVLLLTACEGMTAGYQPPFVPVTLEVGSDGEVAVTAGAQITTPVGTFSVEQEHWSSYEPPEDQLALFVRHEQDGEDLDSVYTIDAEVEAVVELDGQSVVTVLNRRVLVDVREQGTAQIHLREIQPERDLDPEFHPALLTDHELAIGGEPCEGFLCRSYSWVDLDPPGSAIPLAQDQEEESKEADLSWLSRMSGMPFTHSEFIGAFHNSGGFSAASLGERSADYRGCYEALSDTGGLLGSWATGVTSQEGERFCVRTTNGGVALVEVLDASDHSARLSYTLWVG